MRNSRVRELSDGVALFVSRTARCDDARDLMWRCCGLLRTASGLKEAVSQLEAWRAAIVVAAAARFDDEFRRVRSIVTVGLMIARAALRRRRAAAATFVRIFRIATT